MTAKKGGLGRGLGRGLDAMISDTSKPRQAEKTPEKTLTVKEPEGEAKGKVFTVKIACVSPAANSQESSLTRMLCWNWQSLSNNLEYFSRCWCRKKTIIMK